MFMVDAVPIRPLGFRELLDTPFTLIQANIRVLGLAMLAVLVVADVGVVAAAVAMDAASDGSGTTIGWTVAVAIMVAAWFVRLFMRGVATAVGVGSVLGGRPTVKSTVAAVGTTAGPLVLLQLLWSVIGLGVVVSWVVTTTVVFPIGGVLVCFLRAPGFLATPIAVAERLGPGAALARAKVLRAGAIGRIGGLWLMMRAVLGVLVVPVFGLALFVTTYSGTQRWPGIVLIATVVLALVAFSEIVESSTAVVCYVDRLCAREGYDIRMGMGVR